MTDFRKGRALRGPNLFFGGGESITRHGTLIRHTDQVEDEYDETATRNSDAQAIDRDGVLREWDPDIPRVEWLSEVDLDPTRNFIYSSRDFSEATDDAWYTGNASFKRLADSALRLTENTADTNHELRQNNQRATQSTEPLLLSFEFKPDPTRTGVRVRVLELANVANGVTLVYNTETLSAQLTLGGVGFSGEGFNAVKGDDGWWRIAVGFTPPDSTGLQLTFGTAIGSDFDYLGDGVSGANFRRFQMEPTPAGSIPTTYQATPRDTDRDTPSLLLEAAATNEELFSAAPTGWVQTRTTSFDNQLLSPDGATTGGTVRETAENGVHNVSRSVVKAAASEDWTASIFLSLRNTDRFQCTLQLIGSSNANRVEATFNFETGEVTVPASAFGAGFTVIGASIVDYGGGWFRLSVSGNTDATAAVKWLVQLLDETGASSYLGDVNEGVYAWGAQLEQAAAPSSYIPTSGVAVTRAADIFYAPFPHPPQEMTVYQRLQVRAIVGEGTSGRTFHIGGPGFGDPRLELLNGSASAETWQMFVSPAGASGDKSSNAIFNSGEGPVFGDIIELVGWYRGDGSVQIDRAVINGGERVSNQGARSAASDVSPAWFQPRAYIQYYSNFTGSAANLATKVHRGVRSLDYMRAL